MGFALPKMKRRKGSLLRIRTRSHSPVDAIVKPPTIVEEEATDASSSNTSSSSSSDASSSNSNKAATISVVIDESSSNDDSTLSSIHTDSLTSFAGNLSPPEIEFHEDLKDGKISERQSSATSSKKSTKADITPPPKSKTKITPPEFAIIGIPSIPSLISSTSYLMEDFTDEIGQERKDEENTVMTMDLLESIHPFQRESTCDSMMHLFGGLECIDTFRMEDVAEDDDDIAMDSLFDDKGKEFAFEHKPREIIESDSIGASDSDGANKTNKGSDKVGNEIIIKKKYQTGSVVSHLNALYKTSKKGAIQLQLSKKQSGDRSIKKEEVDLIAGVLEIETCRKREQSTHITTTVTTDRIVDDDRMSYKSKMPKSRSLAKKFILLRKKQEVRSRSAGGESLPLPEDDDSRWLEDDDSDSRFF